jgi:hypothetical protein
MLGRLSGPSCEVLPPGHTGPLRLAPLTTFWKSKSLAVCPIRLWRRRILFRHGVERSIRLLRVSSLKETD